MQKLKHLTKYFRSDLMIKSIFILLTLLSSRHAFAANSRLIYGETVSSTSFDPYTSQEASSQRLTDLVFDSLIEIDQDGKYIPSLAKQWFISPDRRSVTFILRKNVQWHNNSEVFTGKDVQKTVSLVKSPKSKVPNKSLFNSLKEVQSINKYSIKIHFDRPMADPLRFCLFKILPAHQFKSNAILDNNHPFVTKPIGTGKYSFVKLNKTGEILLKRNDKYFGSIPKIEEIIMKFYADKNVMSQSLIYKALDLVTFVSPRDLNEIMGDKSLNIIPYDAQSFSFFALNNHSHFFKNPEIRRAVSSAINRKEMLDAFYNGKGTLISGPFSPTSWAYNLNVKGSTYEPKRAREVLVKAGFKDKNKDGIFETYKGKKVKIKFLVPNTGESETIKRISLAFQNYMAEVGLYVQLKFVDWKVWKNKVLKNHDYDMTIASWTFDDASNITSLFHSSNNGAWGNNFVNYHNKEVDLLLSEAEGVNDFDKKRAIYKKLHRILSKDTPYVYLWTLKHHAASQEKLKNVT